MIFNFFFLFFPVFQGTVSSPIPAGVCHGTVMSCDRHLQRRVRSGSNFRRSGAGGAEDATAGRGEGRGSAAASKDQACCRPWRKAKEAGGLDLKSKHRVICLLN